LNRLHQRKEVVLFIKLKRFLMLCLKGEAAMGEYECTDCNEMFHADEPAEDRDICDECRKDYKNAELQ
jgi:hypothetical protein